MVAKSRIRTLLSAILLAALCPLIARSASISNLFNTGVNGAGVAFGSGGIADPHYSLIASPTAATAVTVTDTAYPFPPWFVNNAGSRWIGPAADGGGVGGNYVYRTTFTVPANAILSTVNVFGLWGVDDVATDILINGISTSPPSPSYAPLVPFAVTSGFVFGTNTLDFKITNAFPGIVNPTGLRVDRIVGSYQAVPEPATATLAIVALGGSAVILRRRQSNQEPEASMS